MFRAELGSGLPEGVRLLDHTADVIVEATGPTLEACLARLGAGMFAIFAPPRGPGRQHRLQVEVEADDPQELAIAWLQELLFRSDVGGLALTGFEVELEGRRLRAQVEGRELLPQEQLLGPSVKAPTRHELRVEPGGEGWKAHVVLDV
jgi:SHS2 domain-containing protein